MLQISVDTSCLCLEVKSVELGSGPASRKRQVQGAAESDDQMETGDDPSRRSGGLSFTRHQSHLVTTMLLTSKLQRVFLYFHINRGPGRLRR